MFPQPSESLNAVVFNFLTILGESIKEIRFLRGYKLYILDDVEHIFVDKAYLIFICLEQMLHTISDVVNFPRKNSF